MTDSGFMFREFLKNEGLQVLVEMHGKMYPSLIREFYSNLQCKNGVYQTMVKNIFIILDEDFLVDVGGLGRFDHPYRYFEEKLLSAFEPVRAYTNMLRDSQRHHATSKPIVTALAMVSDALAQARDSRSSENLTISTGFLSLKRPIPRLDETPKIFQFQNTDPLAWARSSRSSENLAYIHFHMDIYKYEGMWTYFEDADFYPESTKLPPPTNKSDEESIAPPVQNHALDEANNDEVEEDDEEAE
ncbi:hypothetical protein Lal_00049292 [Lupinus albus]|nr:hypothetical protein Lal_00049292 [Lupinus albus]